ncbi:unnamed protein product [Triticum turgidum subsp. durum]|uniref:Uncharacterized protein n=1 Tax=Triticum turgidum subsp. durum TaxID=4567 RepID=A0A9R1AQV1_TRITD|nr:unnamed protein product [Triticum turgidum subsp. durum]
MVLRSERELLSQSKEQEDEIAALRLQLEQKDREVKAEKNTPRSCFDDEYCSSPSTPVLNEETAFSLECSIGEAETPPNYGSPDEMFVKDLNPCLTPFSKSRSEEYEESLSSHRSKARPDPHLSSSRRRPVSKSSDHHHKPTSGTGSSKRRAHRSDQDKSCQNLF